MNTDPALADSPHDARHCSMATPQRTNNSHIDFARTYAIQQAGVGARLAKGEQMSGPKPGPSSRVKAQQMVGDSPALLGVEGDVGGLGSVSVRTKGT